MGFFGLLRLGELRSEVLLQVVFIFSVLVTQRAASPINQCQPALDKETARDRIQQLWILQEFFQIFENNGHLLLPERSELDMGVLYGHD